MKSMFQGSMAALLPLSLGSMAQATDLPDPPPCISCFVGTLHLSANPNDPKTQILDDDLFFIDADKLVWKAGKGDITDGASIPPLFRPIIGSPWEADYLPAAVMHDHYCDDEHRVRTWQSTARMFYEAMIVGHTDVIKAKTMYYAVYAFGPHWEKLKPGVPCGAGKVCTFSFDTKISYQPPDYDLTHQTELMEIEARIRETEVRGQPLSLDDLESLSAQKHPTTPFFFPDNFLLPDNTK